MRKVIECIVDRVAAGDEIMLIESMKMEIPALAEEDATVAELHVADTDAVREGQVVSTLKAG